MSRWIWFSGLFVALAAAIGLVVLNTPIKVGSSKQKAPPLNNIHVEVLNGCGINGVAGRVGQHLRSLGFDVMAIDNAEAFTYPESIVVDRAGKPEYARHVAVALGIENTIQQINPDLFRLEEVTVIVGRDYRRLKLTEP